MSDYWFVLFWGAVLGAVVYASALRLAIWIAARRIEKLAEKIDRGLRESFDGGQYGWSARNVAREIQPGRSHRAIRGWLDVRWRSPESEATLCRVDQILDVTDEVAKETFKVKVLSISPASDGFWDIHARRLPEPATAVPDLEC